MVRWLAVAIANFDQQIDYIAARNPRAAFDAYLAVQRLLPLLEQHPNIGRNGRRRGTREFAVPETPFIVIYRVEKGGQVIVVRLLHHAQHWR
jgi:toxin ParE1/3/4